MDLSTKCSSFSSNCIESTQLHASPASLTSFKAVKISLVSLHVPDQDPTDVYHGGLLDAGRQEKLRETCRGYALSLGWEVIDTVDDGLGVYV